MIKLSASHLVSLRKLVTSKVVGSAVAKAMAGRAPRSARNERGMTLIEIIIVLVIIALIMGLIGGKIFAKGAQAKWELTKIKLQQLSGDLSVYQLKNNSFPSDLGQAGIKPEDLKDAWGQPVQYRVMDNGRSVELKSLGADGKDGGTAENEDVIIKAP